MNHITFDNTKDEAIAFTRTRKLEMKRTIAEERLTVRGQTVGFNNEATRWLRV